MIGKQNNAISQNGTNCTYNLMLTTKVNLRDLCEELEECIQSVENRDFNL